MEKFPKILVPVLPIGPVTIAVVGALEALNAYGYAEYAWRSSTELVKEEDLRIAHDEAAIRLGVWIGSVVGLA